MKTKIKLTIPEPCHEDWGKMTPTEQGKFCGSCKKEVFDLTHSSEEEVANKIHNTSGELCVRIPNQFLDKKIELHAAGISRYGKLGTAGAILTAAAFTPMMQSENNVLSDLIEKNSIQIDALQPIKISGTIVNENGEIIANTQVTILQNNHKATMTALANGRFSFQLDPLKITRGKAIIRLEKEGFLTQEKEILIDGNELNGKFVLDVNPELLMANKIKFIEEPVITVCERQTLGQVVLIDEITKYTDEHYYTTAGAMVSYIIREPIEIIQTDWVNEEITKEVNINLDVETVEKNTISVYPNPTADFVNIEMLKSANYSIYVFDINGKMIQTSSFSSTKKQIDLSSFERGNYIVKIIDNDTQENFDGKVVLMR